MQKQLWCWAALALMAGPSMAETTPPSYACDSLSAHRAFDFWLGHWQVTDKSGETIYGHNRIAKGAHGCLLTEAWQSRRGSRGHSSNYYHPGDKQWHQHWVDGSSIIDIAGGLQQGAMVMTGTIYYFKEQRRAGFRGRWTPQPDGRVRQYFEEQNGEGQWVPWFEGFYQKVDGKEQPQGGSR